MLQPQIREWWLPCTSIARHCCSYAHGVDPAYTKKGAGSAQLTNKCACPAKNLVTLPEYAAAGECTNPPTLSSCHHNPSNHIAVSKEQPFFKDNQVQIPFGYNPRIMCCSLRIT